MVCCEPVDLVLSWYDASWCIGPPSTFPWIVWCLGICAKHHNMEKIQPALMLSIQYSITCPNIVIWVSRLISLVSLLLVGQLVWLDCCVLYIMFTAKIYFGFWVLRVSLLFLLEAAIYASMQFVNVCVCVRARARACDCTCACMHTYRSCIRYYRIFYNCRTLQCHVWNTSYVLLVCICCSPASATRYINYQAIIC